MRVVRLKELGLIILIIVTMTLFLILESQSSEENESFNLDMEKAVKIFRNSAKGDRALAGSFDFVLKQNSEFHNLNVTEASKKFLGLMKNFQTKCKNVGRYGKPGDGGYLICMDEHVAPKRNNCLVYSFGIRNEWSFDDAVHDQLGCEVHSFDPSMNVSDHKRKKRLYYHNLGIWDKLATNDLGWKLASLSDIIRMLDHQNRIIDYMKIDVEGAEWPMLKEMLLKDSARNVKQMILEIHTPKYLGFSMTVEDYGSIYTDMKNLDEQLGFKLWTETHTNGCCGRFGTLTQKFLLTPVNICCYELFYLNKKFLS